MYTCSFPQKKGDFPFPAYGKNGPSFPLFHAPIGQKKTSAFCVCARKSISSKMLFARGGKCFVFFCAILSFFGYSCVSVRGVGIEWEGGF